MPVRKIEKNKEGKNRPVIYFDNLSDMVDYGRKDPKGGKRRDSHDVSDYRREWCASDSYADAMTLAFGGWKEGAEKVQTRRAAISQIVEDGGFDVEMARKGPGRLNVAAFYAGHPKPYGVIVDVEGPAKVVKVLVNVCVSGVESPDSIIRKGAAVCSLIDALEKNGRKVELEIVSEHLFWAARAIVKTAGVPLNMPSIAFALAHPSMLRRIAFAALEQEQEHPKVWQNLSGGYGRVSDVPAEMIDENVVYIGSMVGRRNEFSSDENSAAWVKAKCAEQGITLD